MFREKTMKELEINPYTLFSEKWGALSAGNQESGYNAMTIAWGTIGALWEKESHSNRLPVMSVYVRPGRYTDEFMKKEDYFTVAFFNDKDRRKLGYLGSHTGRETDKYAGARLTPVFDMGTVYPQEAELVFICRKIYQSSLKEEEIKDTEIVSFNYPDRDFHNIYVGQIIKIMEKEKQMK